MRGDIEHGAERVVVEQLEYQQDAVDGRAPVLRKDFLVAPVQVHESRAAGADGVLLILKLLDDDTLRAMLDVAAHNDLFVLLEAFDAEDLARLRGFLNHPAHVLHGLNCRNLETLDVDIGRFGALVSRFPSGTVRVAESGLEIPADAAVCAALGYSIALVGSALMRSEDPQALISEMLSAGRAAARAA